MVQASRSVGLFLKCVLRCAVEREKKETTGRDRVERQSNIAPPPGGRWLRVKEASIPTPSLL